MRRQIIGFQDMIAFHNEDAPFCLLFQARLQATELRMGKKEHCRYCLPNDMRQELAIDPHDLIYRIPESNNGITSWRLFQQLSPR